MRAMTWTALLTLMLTAACATTQSDSAVCAGTAEAARAHADALLIDGGPLSKRTGLALLDKRAAGCHP
ncbi:hypothetical protein HYQ43_04720 [Paracoccus pantotrophus]|uniref:Lipoprotein n=1 Tax=Paracoccus pantotrophus TaxID=82367 RepID=A0A7H9BRH4_PARPN|nr:hypothetical protein [Paracoccus pantotrophus]QLH13586.1 hypothetical protein HYQ43_04720 [Paracoccus pantotrophus]